MAEQPWYYNGAQADSGARAQGVFSGPGQSQSGLRADAVPPAAQQSTAPETDALNFGDVLKLTQQTGSSLATFLRKLVGDPFNKGRTFDAVIPVGAQDLRIEHGLGRTLNGAAVVGLSADNYVFAFLPDADAGKFVKLRTLAPVATNPLTVRLRVY